MLMPAIRMAAPAPLTSNDGRPSRRLLIAVEAVTAAAALYGGVGLIADNAIHMPGEWLASTWFQSWTWPGALLLAIVFAPMAASTWAEWRSARGAYALSVLAGGAQVGWIVGQWLVMRHYFFLQPVMLGVGFAVLALAWRAHRPNATASGLPRRRNQMGRGSASSHGGRHAYQ